ncbi:MAG TPA: phosphate acyltransferase PlsX [Alphaproteobacteria bacterium]|nr:phosphate acyltransferase PlsX [Alphaproteobacteria bacterium]
MVKENNPNLVRDTGRRAVIALDAMGGDYAPLSVLKGAEIALKDNSDLKFKIFGHRDKVLPLLGNYKSVAEASEFIHTEESIANDEKPTTALRKAKNSSMFLSIDSVKHGEATAVVSSGNTGALMAISKLSLQTLPGIDRPAIGGLLPTEKGLCVMLDLGANILCDATNLFEFSIMGSSFAKTVLGKKSPSVGLLNVGEERNKGHEVLRSAAAMIEEGGADLNYIGFIEGSDICTGKVDVIVTDGFSGNIALKTAEGTAKFFANMFKSKLKSNIFGLIGLFIASPALLKLKKQLDPRNYNGAMLLGLNGIVVKSHGSADEVGFANAIKVAYKLSKNNINEHIMRDMVASGHSLETDEFLSEIEG